MNPLPIDVQQQSILNAQDDFARLILKETEAQQKEAMSDVSSSFYSSSGARGRNERNAQSSSGSKGTQSQTSGSSSGTSAGRTAGSSGGGTGQPSSHPSDDVSNVGVLALLSTTGRSESGDRVSDILGDSEVGQQDFEQLFSKIDRVGQGGTPSEKKGTHAGTGDSQGRRSRSTTDENIDQLLSGLGDAKSTSVTRSGNMISLEISPMAGDGSGEGGGVLTGAREPEEVTAVVNKHLSALEYCYQRELKSNPNLRGKIVVRFTISTTGVVKDARLISSTLKNEYVERCILSRIRRWDDFSQIDPNLGDSTFRQTFSFGY